MLFLIKLKSMKFYSILLLLCSVTLGCSQNKTKHITEFSQKDINDGILIDVRTPQEFEAGHLDNAVNIDWFAKDFAKKVQTIDKQKPVYVYCKKGGRSIKAARVLDSLGFEKVIDLEGGYDAFIAIERN